MQDQPSRQEIADTLLVASIVAAEQREAEAAANLMTKFASERDAEMKRLAEHVVKPHMRGWAKEWFTSHGLSLPPEIDGEKPVVFAG